jgi:hypothetical protein
MHKLNMKHEKHPWFVYPGFEPGPSRSELRSANHFFHVFGNVYPLLPLSLNFLEVGLASKAFGKYTLFRDHLKFFDFLSLIYLKYLNWANK